jgi:hypothetical protein
LRQRQDAEAVAAAKRVMDWLQKNAYLLADAALLQDPSGLPGRVRDPPPDLATVWRRKGQPMRIRAGGRDPGRRRGSVVRVFGARDYASGSIRHTLSACKGEDAFRTFHDELVALIPTNETVVVVRDNVDYHKSQALREWWPTHTGRIRPFIQPVFLSACAPHRNLSARLWRYRKDTLACHRCWPDLDRHQQATQTLLTGLAVHFHATSGPAVRPLQNLCDTT